MPVPEIIHTESEESAAAAMAKLTESSEAYFRASQLHETAAAHLRRADEQTEKHLALLKTPVRRAVSRPIGAALTQLRRPESVQQALIAAVILGPPKALAES